MARLGFSCACGEVRGSLPDVGLHIVCYCKSCRVADIHAGKPDPAPDPVDLFQVTPDRMQFEAGADKITPFRVKPRGVLRWQTTCCGTLLGNTPASPRVPAFAVHVRLLDDPEAIGPVRTRSFVPRPGGKARHEGLPGLFGTIWRVFLCRLTGRWRQHPFFDTDREVPVKPVHDLTDAERAVLP